MPITIFEGLVDEVEAGIMYVRLFDVAGLGKDSYGDEYRAEYTAEINIKFVSRQDKKYIGEGSVFNVFVRPESKDKKEKMLLRFKKSRPLTKEELANIKVRANKLSEIFKDV